MAELRGAMRTTVAELRALSAEASCKNGTREESNQSWAPSSMNFMLANGEGLIVTRFRSSPGEDPPTLYYKLGVDERYLSDADEEHHGAGVRGVVVASEPQDMSLPALSAWRLLGKDRMLSFHPSEVRQRAPCAAGARF